MRKIFIIFALLGISFLIDYLNQGMALSIPNSILVSIGFIILVAYSLSDLGSSLLSLPKVTGYIIAGIFLGPGILNILSTGTVNELKMFNTLALGLIALNAGLELSIPGIKKIFKTLAFTILGKILLLPIFIGGTFYVIATYYPSLIGSTLIFSQIVSLCLIFSALSIGTSPAIAIAVSAEIKAKGRLTDLVLGAAIFKDLVVVIILAITIAAVKVVLDSSQTFSISTLVYVGQEIGVSLILGLISGLIIVGYVKYIRFQMLLFILCLILGISEVNAFFHGELLLVFIVAGFYVRNFSHFEHEVATPLHLVALPTFIVFFTIAGASIDLSRTFSLLPIAMFLAIARALVYYLSSYFGGKAGGEETKILNKAWLGYLPQAGVTLGLVGLAANQLPSISVYILDIGITFVAINLIIGPLALRKAISSESPEHSAPELAENVEVSPHGNLLDSQKLADDSLKNVFDQLKNEILSHFEKTLLEGIDEWKNTSNFLTKKYQIHTEDFQIFTVQNQLTWLTQHYDNFMNSHDSKVDEFKQNVLITVEKLPSLQLSNFPINKQSLRSFKSSKNLVVKIKVFYLQIKHIVFRKKFIARRVPVKSIAKIYFSVPFLKKMNLIFDEYISCKINVYDQVKIMIESEKSFSSAIEGVQIEIDKFRESCSLQLEEFFDESFLSLENQFACIDLPDNPISTIKWHKHNNQYQSFEANWRKKLQWNQRIRYVLADDLKLISTAKNIDFDLRQMSVKPLNSINQIFLAYSQFIDDKLNLIQEAEYVIKNNEMSEFKLENLNISPDMQAFENLKNTYEKILYDYSTHKLLILFRKIIKKFAMDLSLPRQRLNRADLIKNTDFEIRAVNFTGILSEQLNIVFIGKFEALMASFKEISEYFFENIYHVETIQLHSLDHQNFSAKKEVLESLIESFRVSIEILNETKTELEKYNVTIAKDYNNDLFLFKEELYQNCYDNSLKKIAISRVQSFNNTLENLLKSNSLFSRYLYISISFCHTEFKKVKSRMVSLLAKNSSGKNIDDGYNKLQYLFRERDVESKLNSITPLLRKTFSINPLKDKKYFNVHHELFALLMSYLNREETPVTVLVYGATGTGKSSIINNISSELNSENVINLNISTVQWRGNFFKELALELGCAQDLQSIKNALILHKYIIVIDDLEKWIQPTYKGLIGLQKIFELMRLTNQYTSWIISTNISFYNAILKPKNLMPIFEYTHCLKDLNASDIKNVITQRLAYCGLTVHYSMGSGILGKLKTINNEQIFFKALSRLSNGNLRDAILLWIHSITFDGKRNLEASVSDIINPNIDFESETMKKCIPIFICLIRFGPLSEKEIIEATGMEKQLFKNHIIYLMRNKIIGGSGKRITYYSISPAFHSSIYKSLIEKI